MSEEVTGKFTVKRTQCANKNYRTVAIDEGGKQVGSTFDEEVATKLMSFPEGAVLTLSVDKSGRFWDITDANLAEGASTTEVKNTPTPRKAAATPTSGPFVERDLTYFMGNSARVIAAYLGASQEYVDSIENTENPIEALHKDVVYGAKLLLNEANRKG
jgi:hypothetical protein